MRRINTLNKAANLFGSGKHGFRNGDIATSTAPTEFDADWCNNIQEEIATLIEAAGLTLNPASYSQMLEAIERLIDAQSGNYALDTGAADAYVIAVSPAITAYTNGMTVRFRFAHTNTGASTLDAGAGPEPLVNDVGGALLPGDAPAGGVATAVYDQPLNKFLITSLVPSQAMSQTAADARYFESSISVVPSSSAMTITVNPETLTFRNVALTSGARNLRTLLASASTVISSGSTGGTQSGIKSRIFVALIDVAGTLEVAWNNSTRPQDFDEDELISTTAEGGAGGADSLNVWYSTTARANVPFRIRAFFESTQAAAGTWADAPSTIQGAGGLALAAAITGIALDEKVVTTSGSGSSWTFNPPAWAKRCALHFVGFSTTGAADINVQLNGESSGYNGTTGAGSGSTGLLTTAFNIDNTGAAGTIRHGKVNFNLADPATNTWVMDSNFGFSNSAGYRFCIGSKALAAALNSIVVSTADAGDGGFISASYER